MRRLEGSSAPEPEVVIRRRRRRLRDREALKALILKIILLAAVLAVLFGALFGLTPMKGGDMEPKLSAGDLLLYYRLEKNFARNDVILMGRDGDQYAGRIIAMPGEIVEITPTGTVSIDGNQIVETDIFYETRPIEGSSRYFGPVRRSEIKGKVITSVHWTGL